MNKSLQFNFLLLLTIITLLFWVYSHFFNVYAFKLIGAIYEMLWFPIVLNTFFMPLVTLLFWYRCHFTIISKWLYLFLFSVLILVAKIFLIS
jgi:hypothetical protein